LDLDFIALDLGFVSASFEIVALGLEIVALDLEFQSTPAPLRGRASEPSTVAHCNHRFAQHVCLVASLLLAPDHHVADRQHADQLSAVHDR